MKRIISAILILVFTLCLFGCEELNLKLQGTALTDELMEDAGLRAHFIDVGQGDSILLESKGEFALVDAGEHKESEKVISYLSGAGVKSLKYVISTHPHSDHCGGLREVIYEYDCDNFICPNADSDSDTWLSVLDAVDEKGIAYRTPSPGDNYSLGSATISILSPSPQSLYSSMNNYSIVCKVSYGETSILLTGDAEKTVEDELISNNTNLKANVLKCGHHGSSSSTTMKFLNKVSPDAAIISCGENNDYGHPHSETVEALEAKGIPYWRTDEEGSVLVSSDGKNITVKTASQDSQKVEIAPFTTTVTEIQIIEESTEITYIGNRNSKIFHRPSCGSVEATKEKNKVYFTNRDEALFQQYTPCKSCNP